MKPPSRRIRRVASRSDGDLVRDAARVLAQSKSYSLLAGVHFSAVELEALHDLAERLDDADHARLQGVGTCRAPDPDPYQSEMADIANLANRQLWQQPTHRSYQRTQSLRV